MNEREPISRRKFLINAAAIAAGAFATYEFSQGINPDLGDPKVKMPDNIQQREVQLDEDPHRSRALTGNGQVDEKVITIKKLGVVFGAIATFKFFLNILDGTESPQPQQVKNGGTQVTSSSEIRNG